MTEPNFLVNIKLNEVADENLKHIIKNSLVNRVGLHILLAKFLQFSFNDRHLTMLTLMSDGTWEHIPEPGQDCQYEFHIERVGKKIDWEQIDKHHRTIAQRETTNLAHSRAIEEYWKDRGGAKLYFDLGDRDNLLRREYMRV